MAASEYARTGPPGTGRNCHTIETDDDIPDTAPDSIPILSVGSNYSSSG